MREGEPIRACDVRFLPIVSAYARTLGVVEEGIPIYSRCENGNESDKVVSRNLIPTMVERMAELGQDNFLYVADSALITADNPVLMDDFKSSLSGFVIIVRVDDKPHYHDPSIISLHHKPR